MRTAKRRILCVEDDADTCELLSMLLTQAGYEATFVSTVAAALRLVRSRAFDLYLLDQWLGDGTGIELCQEIRRFDTRTPILFFSGIAQADDRQQGFEAGAQAYLIKPNDIDALVGTMIRLLNESRTTAYVF